MPTMVTCPYCGASNTIPGTFTNVTFENNWVNMAVPCTSCGRDFDAAPGDGTFSTVEGRLQRVRRVARYVAATGVEDLQELRDRLAEAQAQRNEAVARSELKKAGLVSWLSERDNRMELWAVLAVLVGILTIIIELKSGGGTVTEEDAANIAEQREREASSQVQQLPDGAVTEEPAAPRNALCPCGSGRKFKRCHGAPPTSEAYRSRGD